MSVLKKYMDIDIYVQICVCVIYTNVCNKLLIMYHWGCQDGRETHFL